MSNYKSMLLLRTLRLSTIVGLLVTIVGPAEAQLAQAFMVPAAARTAGAGSTSWYSDLSLHNPHEFDLPVVIQALPSNTVNLDVITLRLTLFPYETFNLWDVFGDDLFDIWGTGALLVYYDIDSGSACDPAESCELLATSRTYNLDGDGEYGQTIPGLNLLQGIDWWTYGYAAGVMNDGTWFRTNVGVASWTDQWVTVKVDVQDSDGNILGTQQLRIPPFGHLQRRLAFAVTGGSVVFYIVSGPDDTLVFPYSSVVNQRTGDPSFYPAQPSVVGVSVNKQRPTTRSARRAVPSVATQLQIDRNQLKQKRQQPRTPSN